MKQKIGSNLRSERFPYWLRKSIRYDGAIAEIKAVLHELEVDTVCISARCPNIYECFSKKKCTFLIMGNLCTRACGFCGIENYRGPLKSPSIKELLYIREAVKKLGMHHVIMTSVTRDDLNDGGASHFALGVSMLRELDDCLYIELLVPDFRGRKESIEKIVFVKPDIFSHNIETVPRLYSKVRPHADYMRSLELLRYAKELDGNLITKSGLMVGLGEDRHEVYSVMADLKKSGCDMITIGQYLRPDSSCLEVKEFLHPEEFLVFSGWAKDLGFKKFSCNPFVRSSNVN